MDCLFRKTAKKNFVALILANSLDNICMLSRELASIKATKFFF